MYIIFKYENPDTVIIIITIVIGSAYIFLLSLLLTRYYKIIRTYKTIIGIGLTGANSKYVAMTGYGFITGGGLAMLYYVMMPMQKVIRGR